MVVLQTYVDQTTSGWGLIVPALAGIGLGVAIYWVDRRR